MNKMHTYRCFIAVLLMGFAFAEAQQAPSNPAYEEAVAQAQEHATEGDFNQAEAAYRKAATLEPDKAAPQYNLGNLYYNEDKKFNANTTYKKAADAATTKEEKHKIWHNIGNSLLENKQYEEAVEAYKNALRNDPTDDETRYNLALAKREQDENGGGGGGGDNDQDKNEDSKDGDKDQNSDGKNEGDDKEKEGDDKKGDQDGDQDNDKGKNSEGEDGKDDPQQGGNEKKEQRVEGKMTPQQIKQILEAMENEEQKIQEKIKGKKVKGKTVKTEKDW